MKKRPKTKVVKRKKTAIVSSKPAKIKKLPAPPKIKNKKSKAYFVKFSKLLIERKRALLKNFSSMEDQTLGQTRFNASGDISSTPTHMADIASDNYEQELSLNLLESENEELSEINEALEKIKDGTFGLCENCSKPIPEQRLSAIPYAKLCMDCKKKEEKE
ncbi:MAG: TraR/DksA C4-type zinc finger protein [Planctomycetes bacterium]|nr:TraR/DksA C4-type zinc finger protein [Planctomycetota bacterium]